MASRLHLPADDTVQLLVTHSNIKTFSAEIRFSLQTTVEAVKDKLWKKSGTAMDAMHLELYDDTGSKVAVLDDNSRPLGFYSPHNGYRFHIVDLDPSSVTSGGWLEDTSLVEKYTISDEAYNKLNSCSNYKAHKGPTEFSTKTVQFDSANARKFKEKMISQNPTAPSKKLPENHMEDLCANIKVGDRCEVEPGAKRGVVKFVGKAEALGPGFWVGIQYDEPLGKHDGMVKGVRFFQCPPAHGGIVRPDKVKVGDFPERDPFEDEEI